MALFGEDEWDIPFPRSRSGWKQPEHQVYSIALRCVGNQEAGILPSVKLMRTYGERICKYAKKRAEEYFTCEPWCGGFGAIDPICPEATPWVQYHKIINYLAEKVKAEYKLEVRLHRLIGVGVERCEYAISFHPIEGWKGEGAYA